MTGEGEVPRRGESSGASHFGRPGGEAVVVGAGIGGLAAALALARRGIAVRVLERAGALGEVGAGLQITPNGMAVLDALGVGGAVRDAGLAAQAVELRRAEDGRAVVRMDLAGRDWVLIHRARLVEVLAAAVAAAGVPVETGAEVRAVTDGPEAARLELGSGVGQPAPPGDSPPEAGGIRPAADPGGGGGWPDLPGPLAPSRPEAGTVPDPRGGTRETALVVGADGIRGLVRAALGPAEAARFTGQVAWRALVPGEGPAVAEVHMAPGRHVVTYPLNGGLRNLVAVEARRDWAEEGWSVPGDPEAMRCAFAGISPRLAAMLGAVREAHVWGLHRHPVAPVWHGARVAILGDAAHPTLPFLAQGANMALEDAWALADCLARLPLAQALAAYQARRRARAARIVAAAGRNGWVYHMAAGPQRRALHLGLGLMERLRPGGAIARFDWVYDHDETRMGGA